MFNTDIVSYMVDLGGRCHGFLDVMQERGTQQESLEKEGYSNVFIFPCQTLISGLDLEEPINYDLLKVEGEDLPGKRPFVFVDPRAGRGPGICGSKKDSEVGLALKSGHPVYFIHFHVEPAVGQTMEKVFRGLAHFVEYVKLQNRYSNDPVLVGNCQAGWLLAIVSARYLRHLECPLFLVGSPLSYWSGSGPMKYRGFLSGGSIWPALYADINRGVFDGANLSLNFELQDGSRVIGEKLATLFKDPQVLKADFISNERWWNFFCHMTKEEIVWIVDNLFFGNRLEQGQLYLDGEYVKLSNITGAVVVFFSKGDTITPPPQAINWVRVNYEDEEDLNVPIVCVVHPYCGHLGIFVSSSVAREYHQRVFKEIENITCLEPGLYELCIEPGAGHSLEKRSIDLVNDLVGRDCEGECKILTLLSWRSEWFRSLYEMTLSPYVRLFFSSVDLRRYHPMRSTRKIYCASPSQPLCLPTGSVSMEDNAYKKTEALVLDLFVEWWRHWEDVTASMTRCVMKTLIAFSP